MNYHELLSYGYQFLQNNWTTILAYLGAGGGLSIALQFAKKLRKWESSAWIQFVLGIMTVLTSSADYYINNYTTSPATRILGDLAPKLFVAAVVMHRIAVNPLTKVLENNLGGFVAGFKGGMQSYKDVPVAPVIPVVPTLQPPTDSFQ